MHDSIHTKARAELAHNMPHNDMDSKYVFSLSPPPFPLKLTIALFHNPYLNHLLSIPTATSTLTGTSGRLRTTSPLQRSTPKRLMSIGTIGR